MTTPPRNKNCKTHIMWIVSTLLSTIIALTAVASLTIYIDPLFHYHKPLENYKYPLIDERYQNDGISRNFEYDGIITGSSMVENFKTSEADALFHADFIKIPFSGAHYKEINDNLQRAYDSGKNIKYIIRCLDLYTLPEDHKDAYRTDINYPNYLYNNNPFDDVSYVLNKSILFTRTLTVISMKNTGNNNAPTSFDDYEYWSSRCVYGKEAVLSTYDKPPKNAEPIQALLTEEKEMILENILQNVTALADAHPETIFYLFFPPYSICFWDRENENINRLISAAEIATEEILKHPNIKLYAFFNNFELVCNLDNYKDVAHYGGWVNSQMLEWIYENKYLLTKENYQDYLNETRDFYNSYDYETLWR